VGSRSRTDGLGRFQDTPYNTVVAEKPIVVVSPQRQDNFSLKMTIPGGATTDDYGARSEVVPDLPDFRAGDDYYFSASMLLADGFPVNESWQVVWQWKSELDGSPPLEIDVEDGRFKLSGGEGNPNGSETIDEDLGPAVPGQWTSWVVHVVFSPDPTVGSVEIWRDGAQVLPRMNPPGGTMYEDGDNDPRGYVKYGYYRRSGIAETGTILFEDMRIGSSYDSVALPD